MPNIQVKDASGATQTVQTLPAVGQAAAAASLPVVLASDQSAVPVSGAVATTPPSHASTNVDQIGGAALALGQAAKAACIPVTLASDQPPVQVSQAGASTNRVSYSGAITSATTTAAIAAQGAGYFTYVADVDLFNAGTTSVLVQIQNSGATVLWQAWVPAGGGVSKSLQTPIGGAGQMSANTALSIVTGAGTTSLYANLNGFKSLS